MKQVIVSLSLLLGLVGVAQAQGIQVNEEPTITKMMDIYANVNKAKTAEQLIDGFRIQLLATTDRRKVDQVQEGFRGRYPNVFVGWSQAQPFYRVRVGGFSNRNDATKFLQNIKKDYPDAYIVGDKVKTTELTTF
jgi:cell division septation protein DedD